MGLGSDHSTRRLDTPLPALPSHHPHSLTDIPSLYAARCIPAHKARPFYLAEGRDSPFSLRIVLLQYSPTSTTRCRPTSIRSCLSFPWPFLFLTTLQCHSFQFLFAIPPPLFLLSKFPAPHLQLLNRTKGLANPNRADESKW